MLRRTTLIALLTLTPMAATSALAGGQSADTLTELREAELPQIEETGITAFDSVFMKVGNIHGTLDNVQARIFAAQDNIATAVGQPEGTPIAMSLWELKQKAGGPIEVEMRGGKPYLTLGGTGSQEAQAMLTQVNNAAAEVASIPAELAKLPPQVQELVGACQQFPSQLNPQLLQEAGMTPMQLPKVAKTLGKNVKATAQTPKRIDNLVKASKGFVEGIPQGIAATEAPTAEYIAAKKADKKSKKDKKQRGKASGTAVAGGMSGDVPPSRIGSLVGSALTAFHDAEVSSAVRILGQADAELAKMGEPVPLHELETLYQTTALVHLVDGNAAAASASVTQALVIDPDADALKDLGPEYAKLHKMLVKSDIVRAVDVPVYGQGVAYISGRRVEGDSQVRVGAGKHLVQVKRGDQWVSQVVWVDQGYQLQL